MMSPDTETLKRAQNGDMTAFTAVVDSCYDTIFRFALKYTGHRQDAEDIAQQACIKLARSLGSYRFESAFTSWLYTLVLNCARDWHRQQRGFNRVTEEEESITGTDSDAAESQVYLRQILDQVEAMGTGFRETLVLVAGEGLSHAEAGELLGVKESTVSWRLHEIRKKLAAANGQESLA